MGLVHIDPASRVVGHEPRQSVDDPDQRRRRAADRAVGILPLTGDVDVPGRRLDPAAQLHLDEHAGNSGAREHVREPNARRKVIPRWCAWSTAAAPSTSAIAAIGTTRSGERARTPKVARHDHRVPCHAHVGLDGGDRPAVGTVHLEVDRQRLTGARGAPYSQRRRPLPSAKANEGACDGRRGGMNAMASSGSKRASPGWPSAPVPGGRAAR